MTHVPSFLAIVDRNLRIGPNFIPIPFMRCSSVRSGRDDPSIACSRKT